MFIPTVVSTLLGGHFTQTTGAMYLAGMVESETLNKNITGSNSANAMPRLRQVRLFHLAYKCLLDETLSKPLIYGCLECNIMSQSQSMHEIPICSFELPICSLDHSL